LPTDELLFEGRSLSKAGDLIVAFAPHHGVRGRLHDDGKASGGKQRRQHGFTKELIAGVRPLPPPFTKPASGVQFPAPQVGTGALTPAFFLQKINMQGTILHG